MAMKRSSNPRDFLTAEEKQSVEAAVAAAEKGTSAEIKLVIVRHCWTGIREKAVKVFRKLGLQNTAQRNCVLLLLVLANREFLIYGDEGIHEKVGQSFWDDVKEEMGRCFAEGRFGEGLAAAVETVGEKLAAFFPYQEDDRDEISNEVAYEE